MNTSHALGFLICGISMILLPSLAPSLVEAAGEVESSRELWLLFMGSLKACLGGGWLVRTGYSQRLVPAVSAWAAARDRRATPAYATWRRTA